MIRYLQSFKDKFNLEVLQQTCNVIENLYLSFFTKKVMRHIESRASFLTNINDFALFKEFFSRFKLILTQKIVKFK